MNIYYTYAYLREDGTPYYIGKGSNKRIHNKHHKIPLPPKNRRIYLKQNLPESEAFKHEIYMIFLYGRKDIKTGILLNMSDGGEMGGCRVCPTKKSTVLFGIEYDSIYKACKENNIRYSQYKILINENLPFNNGEDLKKFIWERRNSKISINQKGNKNKRGWKSNPITYLKQSESIKKALSKKTNKYS